MHRLRLAVLRMLTDGNRVQACTRTEEIKVAQWQPSVTVIAIAGPSGGGKTTLVDQVAALLGNTTRLYFDDYAAVSSYPQDVPGWIAAGADPNDWRTPRLAGDLQTIVDPFVNTEKRGVLRYSSFR